MEITETPLFAGFSGEETRHLLGCIGARERACPPGGAAAAAGGEPPARGRPARGRRGGQRCVRKPCAGGFFPRGRACAAGGGA